MSLLDTASLIVTPNGYKEGKLYSVIPSDGSGDLSVTRATTATRVNSQGLVELVPYNLVQYSEDFSNGVWISGEVSLTSGQSSPLGTNTAFKITGISATNAAFYQVGIPVTSGNTYTASVYLKGATSGSVSLRVDSGSTAPNNPVSYTTQWQRFTYTFTAGSTTAAVVLGGYGTWTGSEEIFVYGFQLVEGSVAKDYQKTETRLNIPRLDYSNGTCPSILVEPQRTNLVTYSSSLDNAAYTQAQYGTGTISVTANYGLAPDGTMTADRVQMTQGNFASELFQRPSTTAGQTYTISFWAKSLSGTPTLYTAFNLGYANSVTFTTEWVRYEYTYTAAATSTATGFNLITWGSLSGTSASADILVWGVQHELGSYATSYIPTTSTSVTRNADLITKTNATALIGQTEGTIFGELYVIPQKADSMLCLIANTTGGLYSDFFYIRASNGVPAVSVRQGDVTYVSIDGTTALSEGFHKFAFAYKQNDFAFYVDGQLIGTDTSGNVPTCNSIYLGQYLDGFDREVSKKSFALWKTRLTNTQLAQLTTI